MKRPNRNENIALKHFMIAVKGGCKISLNVIKDIHMFGHATKDEYNKALLAHQEYLNEVKSDQRDEAAAFNDMYTYC